jgi:hypothetical protein
VAQQLGECLAYLPLIEGAVGLPWAPEE